VILGHAVRGLYRAVTREHGRPARPDSELVDLVTALRSLEPRADRMPPVTVFVEQVARRVRTEPRVGCQKSAM
jgi:hypothetical protein